MSSLNDLKQNAQKNNPCLNYDDKGKMLSYFISGRMIISNLTHQELSTNTGINIDKVKLIQAGAVSFDDNDFQSILKYFEITKPQIEEIINKN